MTDLRCPVDGKLFLQYDEQGRIHIKCRGRCAHHWVIAVVDGRPVVVFEDSPPLGD